MNARIWLGIHFRRAMTDGNGLGQDVAAFVLRQRVPADPRARPAAPVTRGLAARADAS